MENNIKFPQNFKTPKENMGGNHLDADLGYYK